MANRFAGQIWIGGKVPRKHIAGLVEALWQDDGSHQFDDRPIQQDCTEMDDLARYLDDESLLDLRCSQAHNGEFEATEHFCRKNGIPYNRWSAHCDEYDAENVQWRPGMKEPFTSYADSHNDEIVNGETVRLALYQLKQISSMTMTNFKMEEVVTEARKLLEAACPTEPVKLEPFEIIP
jgi:hypothetical protein